MPPKAAAKAKSKAEDLGLGFRCALDMYFQSRFGTPKRGPERGLNSRASLKDLHCAASAAKPKAKSELLTIFWLKHLLLG